MFCVLKRILKRLQRIEEALRVLRFMLTKPSGISIRVIGEYGMAIKFAVQLPELPANIDDANEIESGVLTVTIGDGETFEINIPKEVMTEGDHQVVDDRFIGPQDTDVTLEYAYIDNAGNLGESVSAVQPLLDTVPPVAPDSIGLVATEEVPDVV